MGFWIFMFICNLLIPITMILLGRTLMKHPPNRINRAHGYRTAMSMKNMDTWIFANTTSGKLWWCLGWLLLIPSIIVQFPFMHSSKDTIGFFSLALITVQLAALITSVIPVEKALKKTFHPDGSRR